MAVAHLITTCVKWLRREVKPVGYFASIAPVLICGEIQTKAYLNEYTPDNWARLLNDNQVETTGGVRDHKIRGRSGHSGFAISDQRCFHYSRFRSEFADAQFGQFCHAF
jgi:hypothetical protein